MMKKFLVFTLSLFLVFSFGMSAGIRPCPNNDDEKNLFYIDDSLLIANYPNAGIKPTCNITNNRTFSHVLHTHFTPSNSLSPEYLIIVEKNLFFSLTKEIITYAEDVHAVFGYGIILEYVENPNPESLKSLIVSYQNNLCGVFLIGNLGECIYEVQNDYDTYGYRNWPCDLFFMDLDGTWADTDSNGMYDHHSGNVAPEIFLGRLCAYGLSSYGNEEDLIRRQLQKSHSFWWYTSFHAQETTLNYIDRDWINCFQPDTIRRVFPSQYITDVRNDSLTCCFSVSDYLSKISSNIYGFTHLAAHSSPLFHLFDNEYIYNYTIKPIISNNYAYSLFCCSACNWLGGDNNGYLGGAYLFNNGKTIAVVGTTKTGGMFSNSSPYFYSHLANGNLGNAFRQWWNCWGNNHTDTIKYWTYGMTILGDPTIDFRYKVSDLCLSNLSLTTFPSNNTSNLVLYKAGNKITVSGNYIIPQGVHVIFDAPQVEFEENFSCPLGASFETRNEGCEL